MKLSSAPNLLASPIFNLPLQAGRHHSRLIGERLNDAMWLVCGLEGHFANIILRWCNTMTGHRARVFCLWIVSMRVSGGVATTDITFENWNFNVFGLWEPMFAFCFVQHPNTNQNPSKLIVCNACRTWEETSITSSLSRAFTLSCFKE